MCEGVIKANSAYQKYTHTHSYIYIELLIVVIASDFTTAGAGNVTKSTRQARAKLWKSGSSKMGAWHFEAGRRLMGNVFRYKLSKFRFLLST